MSSGMSNQTKERPVAFFSSITSDIGIALAKRYAKEGYVIAGTYRSRKLLPELTDISSQHLFFCDLGDRKTIYDSVSQFSKLELRWETFISCAAWPPPLTPFFESDFEEWGYSLHVNAVEQLRVLHAIYPFRVQNHVPNVIFFAGPGTNNSVKNFSALTVSKLILIKMCELLDAENEKLNIFTIGPGWTKTKTHQLILSDPHVSAEKYNETLDFMKNRQGTSMDHIYECIRWLSAKGRGVAGGRNFSIVHDLWGTKDLADELLGDSNMYKLRRFRNNWKDRAT